MTRRTASHIDEQQQPEPPLEHGQGDAADDAGHPAGQAPTQVTGASPGKKPVSAALGPGQPVEHLRVLQVATPDRAGDRRQQPALEPAGDAGRGRRAQRVADRVSHQRQPVDHRRQHQRRDQPVPR